MADSDKQLLATATARLKRSIDASATSRKYQVADLKFLSGNSDNLYQWDSADARKRVAEGRPVLTINSLPHHQHQITNELRQNRPAGKVLPVDDRADPRTAAILTDWVRHIEVSSDADVALDTACFHQTAHGEGYYRVVAEYVDSLSFEQDLRFKQVKNPFAVYDDPDIKHPVGIDRRWCFIVEEITEEEHKARYPGRDFVSFEEAGEGDQAAWCAEGRMIRVAEYYRIESERETICLWADGSVSMKGDESAEAIYAARGIQRAMKDGKPVERETEIPVVKWLKTNGREILEKEVTVPGFFIPLFRVVGNEYEIDGRREVSGIVRPAKDPCRMINFWWSQEAEWLAKAPKTPWVGYEGQFEGHEQEFANAAKADVPYLQVKPVVDEASGSVLPLPQRQQPPMPPAGIIEAKLQSVDALKQTTGYYDASLGARSNETSGRAIVARERQSDVGSFHYTDNLALAVKWHVRYLIDVCPDYYDTRRIARIIGEDGAAKHAVADPDMKESYAEQEDAQGEIQQIFNPGVGKFDVVASTGPSYMTRRIEAAEGMQAFIQAAPQMLPVVGDLFVKNLDWPGADEIAERLRRLVPPQALGDQQGADPQQMQAKLAQMGQVVEALTKELQQKTADMDGLESKIKTYEAETKRITALKDFLPPAVAAQLIAGSLLTSEDLDEIGERMHPQEMQEAMEPHRKPPNGLLPPMAGGEMPSGPLQ